MHTFDSTTFIQPTFCDDCHKFIWGVHKQGKQCSECKISLHHHCQSPLPCVETVAKPLNMLTTTKNMHKFMLRIKFLRTTERILLNIIMWTDPTFSILAILAYTLVCLYPVLLFILPNIAIASIGILSHPKVSGKEPQQTYTIPPKTSPQDYKFNMQYIQNLMGNSATMIDTIVLQYHEHLTWKQEQHTMKIVQLSFASIPIVIIIYMMIPLRVMFLLGGWTVFLINSPLKDHIHDIAPLVKELMQPAVKVTKRVNSISVKNDALPGDTRQSLSIKSHPILPADSPSSAVAHTEETTNLTIYENQKSVNGSYVPTSSSVEDPPAYSDQQGSIPFPSPENYKPPPGYSFVNEWHIDKQWAPVDEEGWCLTDKDYKKTDKTLATTRRRKWIRVVCKSNSERKRLSNPIIMKSQGSLTDFENRPPMRSSSLIKMDDKSTDEEIIEEYEDSTITSPLEEHIYEYSYK